MILAIDFDGVIHDFKHPVPGRRMGGPIDGTKEALTRYKQLGHKVVVYTIWPKESQQTVHEWMKYYEIPYDDVTNTKGQADYYIDDKAIRFTNWPETLLLTS